MSLVPIVLTLRRHRTAAALIVAEIALTCAIVCNAIFLIGDRIERMARPTGIAEDELVQVKVAGFGKHDGMAVTQQDLAALRAIPGVRSVAIADMVPFGGSEFSSDISTIPNDPHRPINVAMYFGSPDLFDTLGLSLTMGRQFRLDDFVTFEQLNTSAAHPATVMITHQIAERLFPGQNPLGKQLYIWGDQPQTVIGVLDRLARPNMIRSDAADDYAVFQPVNPAYTDNGIYLLRTAPGLRAAVLAAVEAALYRVDPNRTIVRRQTFSETRAAYFRNDRSMAWLLAGVSIALLVVTALGVVGLASFWVQQRTRQIGVRRALGATRGDILRYFQLENFILATIGIVVGMALAYAINLWLMRTYHVPRLPAEFLPIGALLLWLLGQVAVLGPALRASMIPPALATRSV